MSTDILEAVFRWQFRNNASMSQDRAGAYFLEVEQGDPGDQLLARFVGHKPVVYPYSAAIVDEATGLVSHARGGRPGLIFYVTEIRCRSEDEAEVEGGYYEGNLSSSGNTYQVIRSRNRWSVAQDSQNWISEAIEEMKGLAVLVSRIVA